MPKAKPKTAAPRRRPRAAGGEEEEPLVVHAVEEWDGMTFSLAPAAERHLREAFPDATLRRKVYIGMETPADKKTLHGTVSPEVVALLTGLDRDSLRSVGEVSFRDPVSQDELWSWSPDRR